MQAVCDCLWGALDAVEKGHHMRKPTRVAKGVFYRQQGNSLAHKRLPSHTLVPSPGWSGEAQENFCPFCYGGFTG